MKTWNAGRFAPSVSLTLVFDKNVNILKLCPNMRPETGRVGLVVKCGSEETQERVPHSEIWHEGEWVSIAIPTPASEFHIEFIESPSWIALYAVDGVYSFLA
jgi:hypothetical protein